MKIILPTSNFTFTPSLNQVNFTPMGGAFKRQNLYAVINITTGKLIYAVASVASGFGGTFAGNVLTYASSNVGQLNTDVLQVIYDDENAVQTIAGSVTIQDPANVKGVVGTASAVASAIHDGSGTLPILSTPDPLTLREGLDIHVQSASVQGLLNNPLPLPYQNQALSVGYINGGDLVTPAMNIGTNELIVDATQSGNIPVSIDAVTTPITVDIGTAPTLNVNLQSSGITQPVSAVGTFPVSAASALPISAASLPLPSGAATETTLSGMSAKLPATLGQKVSAQSLAVVLSSDNVILPDQYITGQATLTGGNNIFLASAGTGSIDATGFKSGSVQIVTTATTGAMIFEHSNDNVNFQPMLVFRSDSVSSNALGIAFTPTSSQFIYHFPIKARYIRCRITTTLGATAQAFLRLSQESWAPITPNVINATAANLNATVTGSVTASIAASQTLATVATVSNVTACSLSAGSITDISLTAITASSTTANISVTSTQAASYLVNVTAISGAGAAMDVEVQESLDGTNYFTVYTFERITAIGQYYSPVIKLTGVNFRYVRTVSGTSPSITNTVVRNQRSGSAETIRRFINRTIDLNTLNSVSGSFLCEGVEDFNLMVRTTAQTTAATVALQFSMDNTNWFTSTATVSSVVGIGHTKIDNMQFKFVRAIVTSAGSGITLGEIVIGGHST